MSGRRLDRGGIVSPCPVSWNSMSGTDVTRTCATCARQVHDLSAMTTAKAEALLFSSNERICVRYVRSADGTIQTKDRPARAIQKGPYAGLSAAALAAAVALSQPACSTPSNQPVANEPQQTPDRSRAVGRAGFGTLAGRVDVSRNRGIEDERVVAINEATGDEHSTQTTRDGEFSLELPAGSYTIAAGGNDPWFPAGEGGVVVRSGGMSTIVIQLSAHAMGEYRHIFPDTPPPPLPELNEPPVPASSSKSSIAEIWNHLIERTKQLLR